MMDPSNDPRRRDQLERNRDEYPDLYNQLHFLSPAEADGATAERATLLERLALLTVAGARGTKLDMNRLSPGCRACVAGEWSCLFINGRCNCDCFYCPTSQEEVGIPTTNSVSFRTPADYVAYLERFGFRGASLSGGEPLLTPGRTLAFLRAIKERFGSDIHLWLYTNGSLITPDILAKLRDAGLDEIRFDIGATGYHLTKAKLAVGMIPTVTVEIPAVPEEEAIMRDRLIEMADAGIAHLNLHQLRLTPHNSRHLGGRPYRYLHGEKVTVLDSELTALRLLLHAREKDLPVGVNYCSFVYKNRFQREAAYRRGGRTIAKPYESLTVTGAIRTLSLAGEGPQLDDISGRLQGMDVSPELWQRNGSRLLIHPSLLERLESVAKQTIAVSYAAAETREKSSGRAYYQEVRLPSGRKMVVERWPLCREEELTGDAAAALIGMIAGEEVETAKLSETVARFELPMSGLQEYW